MGIQIVPDLVTLTKEKRKRIWLDLHLGGGITLSVLNWCPTCKRWVKALQRPPEPEGRELLKSGPAYSRPTAHLAGRAVGK